MIEIVEALNSWQAVVLDVLATLLAGAIGAGGAVLGVMLQRRWERRDRLEEEERQRTEIARALLFEVVGFYETFVTDMPLRSDLIQSGAVNQVALKSPLASSFPVFTANAHRIGEFEGSEVKAVLAFYVIAGNFLSTVRDCVETQIQYLSGLQNNYAQASTRANLQKLEAMLPRVKELASGAASALAARATVAFDAPTFTIR